MSTPRFVEIAGCACPAPLADPVRRVMAETGATPTSICRSSDPECAAILHRNGKGTQADLVRDPRRYGVLGIPNPVGRSTHEQRSDGVAYSGPIGRRLKAWECGMDWPDASIPDVMAAFTRMRAVPIHPYAAGVEYHHINLRRKPILFRALKLGSTGPRVALLTHRLRIVEAHGKREHHHGRLCPYTGRYGPVVRRHLVAFQEAHGLKGDGVCGPATWRNLEAAARAAKKAKKARRR
jgi:putative peptidoglycan binding protein